MRRYIFKVKLLDEKVQFQCDQVKFSREQFILKCEEIRVLMGYSKGRVKKETIEIDFGLPLSISLSFLHSCYTHICRYTLMLLTLDCI